MDETAFPELRDEITVYGVTWCPDCRQSRAVFEETLTPYVWVDIDKSKKGEKFWWNRRNMSSARRCKVIKTK